MGERTPLGETAALAGRVPALAGLGALLVCYGGLGLLTASQLGHLTHGTPAKSFQLLTNSLIVGVLAFVIQFFMAHSLGNDDGGRSAEPSVGKWLGAAIVYVSFSYFFQTGVLALISVVGGGTWLRYLPWLQPAITASARILLFPLLVACAAFAHDRSALRLSEVFAGLFGRRPSLYAVYVPLCFAVGYLVILSGYALVFGRTAQMIVGHLLVAGGQWIVLLYTIAAYRILRETIEWPETVFS